MTHQDDYKLTNEMVAKGMEAAPELMRVLLNNAMQNERSKYLQAEEYETDREPKRACQRI